MNHVISLKNVTKRYGQQLALDRATLEVPPGVVFALLGENGAGKTTAIRLMLGLAGADAGRVEVLGLDSGRQSLEIRRRVGYVSERPTLYDWMTPAEIGWFTSGFRGPGFEHRFQQLIEQFQVPPQRRLKQLSKGMRAKVALSLAMAHEPPLLILDEPTSGLDTLVRREFLESMVDIAAEGRTVLLSSHQIGEVERVADIVAIVRGGRILLVESLDELKRASQELTVTVAENHFEPPAMSGEVLRARRRARQWQVLVRHPHEEELDKLRDHETTVAVEVRSPSLEEIFVAYMQSHDTSQVSTNFRTALASE